MVVVQLKTLFTPTLAEVELGGGFGWAVTKVNYQAGTQLCQAQVQVCLPDKAQFNSNAVGVTSTWLAHITHPTYHPTTAKETFRTLPDKLGS